VVSQVWLVPLLPLLGALIAACAGRWLKERAHWPVIAGIALSFLVSLSLLPHVGPAAVGHGGGGAGHETHGEATTRVKSTTVVVYRWLEAGETGTGSSGREMPRFDLDIPIEFRVDGLTVMMLCMVTFVATLVAIFAAGYMAGDPGYARFFAEVGLFVFCMTGLVLSNNYVLTYAFWEGVGVCSYLLVGFWYKKPSAAAAAKKAFLVNRVGDVGFALAIFWMWTVSPGHDLSYDAVLNDQTLHGISSFALAGIGLLLFWAATAKSAQLPLYVWLPDAMEGPTPVSALIHAATMVTAGVYLIARSAALVFATPWVPLLICGVGCATALFSALMALTQHDLKRVLAYSTISQLGYMFMALGAGVGDVQVFAVVAAMFHLFTHAFFKALLFLGSGSVMHAIGHVIDMRRFGGLRQRMPITCWTFAIGGLALAGIFPLAGFFSKDEVLASIRMAADVADGAVWKGAGFLYFLIYALAILTAFLTAFYTGRAFFRTFFGPEKLPSPSDPEAEHEAHDDHGHDHAGDPHFGHESPRTMTIPLIVLAACTVVVGLAFGPNKAFEHLLERTPSWSPLAPLAHAHGADWMSIGLGTLAGIGGLALAWVSYGQPSLLPGRLASSLRPFYEASYHKFFVDEVYTKLFVGPTRALASICRFLDVYLIDGVVKLVAWIPQLVGRDFLAPLQNGLLQFYAGASAVGVVLVLVFLLFT
jgi:NADH-quinone oxidoreductase subunit L